MKLYPMFVALSPAGTRWTRSALSRLGLFQPRRMPREHHLDQLTKCRFTPNKTSHRHPTSAQGVASGSLQQETPLRISAMLDSPNKDHETRQLARDGCYAGFPSDSRKRLRASQGSFREDERRHDRSHCSGQEQLFDGRSKVRRTTTPSSSNLPKPIPRPPSTSPKNFGA